MDGSFSRGSRCTPLLVALHAQAHAWSQGPEPDFQRALIHTDDALEVAINLHNQSFFIDLLRLRGDLNLMTQHYTLAAEDFTDLAEELHTASDELQGERAALAPLQSQEVRALLQLAAIVMNMIQPNKTEELLDRALSLLVPDLSDPARIPLSDRAVLLTTISYIRSLLAHMRGDAAVAWKPALEAARNYTRANDTTNAVRAEIHAVDTLLAFARTLPEGTVALKFACLARTHADTALQLANAGTDAGILAVAALARARVNRMLAPDSSRLGVITEVLDFGESRSDRMLQSQAYIALAEEREFLGEIGSALVCYRRALTVLSKCDFPMLGLPARRALAYYEQSS